MVDFPLAGGCQCGAVRYCVLAPPRTVFHCHCSMCRESTGATFVTFAVMRRDEIQLERGEDNLAAFDSSENVRRLFCKTCGCSLFLDVPGSADMRAYGPATLDDRARPGHGPEAEFHCYVGSKVTWFQIGDSLPQYDGSTRGAEPDRLGPGAAPA